MNKKTKHLLSSIIFGLTSILYFFLAYIGFSKQNIHLENIIIDKGIDTHYSSKGRKSDVFYISLKGLEEDLGIYRMSKKYDDLLKKFDVGDKVKVFYRPSKDLDNINIDLIQVEKNGQIIIHKEEYEKKESSLIYIGLFAGFATILMAYRYYRFGKIF